VISTTGSLYFKLLVDPDRAVENFMKAHRLLDVKKVPAEVRTIEIDALRRAARVLAEQLEDPHIDQQKLVIHETAEE
jgi:hypothetical protein